MGFRVREILVHVIVAEEYKDTHRESDRDSCRLGGKHIRGESCTIRRKKNVPEGEFTVQAHAVKI